MMAVRAKSKQGRLPWFPCYPGNLLNTLAGLSVDQQVVYMVVLLRIYEVGGPIVEDEATIARRTGMTKARAKAALDWLAERGKIVLVNGYIFNDTAEEVIASQHATTETRKSAAKEAAEARWKKEKQKQQNVDAIADAPALPFDAHKEREREKEKKEDTKPRPRSRGPSGAVAYSEEFETRVWGPYPRKASTSKKNAWLKWLRLTAEEQKQVVVAIPVFAQQMRGRDEDKIKHLEFFLSGRIFETVTAPAERSASGAPAASPATFSREQWVKILEIWRSSDNWRLSWGPAPGKPGCFVPADLLARYIPPDAA